MDNINEVQKKSLERGSKVLDENIVLNKEDRDIIENLIKQIHELIKDAPSKENQIKEKQYSDYKELITAYNISLNELKFNFILDREEYLYLKNLILHKLSYNRENIFLGLLIKDNFFNHYDSDKSYNKTNLFKTNTETFKLTIVELTRISHISNLVEIKGLDKEAELYSSIVRKIGDISKAIDYFDTIGAITTEKGSNWISMFDNNKTEEQPQEVLTPTTVE